MRRDFFMHFVESGRNTLMRVGITGHRLRNWLWGADNGSFNSKSTFSATASIHSEWAFECVLQEDGLVHCWGDNTHGQLGNGTLDSQAQPRVVLGLRDVVDVGIGRTHCVALRRDGTVACWGDNRYFQLGGTSGSHSPYPVTVPGLNHVVAISAGRYHTCALLQDGSVVTWGRNNFGQLGNGNERPRRQPYRVPGIQGAIAIHAALYYSYVVLNEHEICYWGYDLDGRLGMGIKGRQLLPKRIHHRSFTQDKIAPLLHFGVNAVSNHSHPLQQRQHIIRRDMLESIEGCDLKSNHLFGQRLQIRILQARSIQELWVLRDDWMRLLAINRGERYASIQLGMLNNLFEGTLVSVANFSKNNFNGMTFGEQG